MNKLFEILFTMVKMILVTLALIIELPIKLIVTVLFIALFIIMAFFAPLLNKIEAPEWWDTFVDYIRHPLKFILVEFVIQKWDI